MSEADATTHRLVVGAKSGDHAAREALFARYAPRVSRMVAARLGVRRHDLPGQAEDVVQEALMAALRGLDGFEMRGPGAFMAWMATIVQNCVRRSHRDAQAPGERALWQRYGDFDLHDSVFASQQPSPSHLALRREANDRIEAAVLTLPTLYREALALRCFAQLSHAEIAQQLGRSEVNARKIVQRAFAMLESALARRE